MDRRTMMLQTATAIAAWSVASAPRAAANSTALNALFDQFMQENLDLSPMTVTFLGLDTGPRVKQKSQLDQASEEAIARQKALVASQLARLKAFDRSTLSRSDAIGYDVVMYGLRTTDEANRAFQYGTGGAGRPMPAARWRALLQGVTDQSDDDQHAGGRDPSARARSRRRSFGAYRCADEKAGHDERQRHHLQLSIQQEADLPLIRKVSGYTSYVEGWALYAEQLAVEMGEYDDDPQGLIGQLHDSMFRAVRLVVDTGIHSMKWSRERAIQYYTDTLGDPLAAATTEVERYCVMPDQACCYMLGKTKFLAERRKSQQALGAKFDIRKFHDAMLLPGAVPLDLLDGLYV